MKYTAFSEKSLGHAPREYSHAESIAWAIGYNAALERTAAPELLEALKAWHYAYSECTGTDQERREAKIKAGNMTRVALAKANKANT